ncbi:MAG: transaldolase family protein [Candidatus Eremiobacteraeota bacterium]|nr:transaldolase family protein [Candidatus Eremiobacteraeota bacterium]
MDGEEAMMLCIDSADFEELRTSAAMPFIAGATTNPALIGKALGKEKVTIEELLAFLEKVRSLVNGHLFVQTLADDAAGIIKEARHIHEALKARCIIKIPATEEGLRALGMLETDGIATAATAVHTSTQAYLALLGGTRYVIPYYSRMETQGHQGLERIGDLLSLTAGTRGELLVASVKNAADVHHLLMAGVRCLTLPLAVIREMCQSPFTEKAVRDFSAKLSLIT